MHIWHRGTEIYRAETKGRGVVRNIGQALECTHFMINPDDAIACSQQFWVLHLDGELSDR